MTGHHIPPVLLVGAGKMGGAMFAGWCRAGLAPSVLIDPHPQPGLARACDQVVDDADTPIAGFAPAAIIVAVKPQMADAVLPKLTKFLRPNTIVLSIMAGRKIAGLSAALGGATVMRAMPNTPAAIGRGITVACAGPGVTDDQLRLCDTLLAAVGEVAFVDDEALIDPVTAVSGSGPAYIFLLAELMEQAGIEAGLPPDLARRLARRTVSGSGALMDASPEDAAVLRRAVTSPKGTTERALAVLMAPDAWPRTIREAINAATKRAGELSG